MSERAHVRADEDGGSPVGALPTGGSAPPAPLPDPPLPPAAQSGATPYPSAELTLGCRAGCRSSSTAALVVTVAGLRAFAGLVAPVFLALVLTVATHPLLGLLRRMGAPSWQRWVLTLVGVFGIVFGLAGSLALFVPGAFRIVAAFANPDTSAGTGGHRPTPSTPSGSCMTVLWVALGATVGAPLHYLTDRGIQRLHPSIFPWGRFTVNVAGSSSGC